MIQIFDKIKVLFHKEKKLYNALHAILGFYPKDIELYKTAFTHRSNNQRFQQNRYGRRRDERHADAPGKDNERLEYLGDAVLETVVSEILFHQYPTKREGFLTATRSKLVARETLGKLAKQLELERFMKLPKTGGNRNSYAGGNAFEALVGAIFLDRGYKYAYHFIRHLIKKQIVDVDSTAKKEVNFKSRLLEYCQKNKIQYTFDSSAVQLDKQASPEFTSQVTIEGLLAGEGKGLSKKESEQNAAKSALVKMRREPAFIDEILRAKEGRTAMEAPEFGALPRIREIDEEVKLLNKLAREEKERKAAEPKAEAKPRKAEKHVKARERRAAQQVKAAQEQAQKEMAQVSATEEQPKAERPAPQKKEVAVKTEQTEAPVVVQRSETEKPKREPKAKAVESEMVIVENVPAVDAPKNEKPATATPKAKSTKKESAPVETPAPASEESASASQTSAPVAQAPASTSQAPASASQKPAVAALVEALRASSATAAATVASQVATASPAKKAAVAELVNKLAASAKQQPATEGASSASAEQQPAIASLLGAMAQSASPAPVASKGTAPKRERSARPSQVAKPAVAESATNKASSQKTETPSAVEASSESEVKKTATPKPENRRRKKAKPEPTPEEQAANIEEIKAAAMREIHASNGRMYE